MHISSLPFRSLFVLIFILVFASYLSAQTENKVKNSQQDKQLISINYASADEKRDPNSPVDTKSDVGRCNKIAYNKLVFSTVSDRFNEKLRQRFDLFLQKKCEEDIDNIYEMLISSFREVNKKEDFVHDMKAYYSGSDRFVSFDPTEVSEYVTSRDKIISFWFIEGSITEVINGKKRSVTTILEAHPQGEEIFFTDITTRPNPLGTDQNPKQNKEVSTTNVVTKTTNSRERLEERLQTLIRFQTANDYGKIHGLMTQSAGPKDSFIEINQKFDALGQAKLSKFVLDNVYLLEPGNQRGLIKGCGEYVEDKKKKYYESQAEAIYENNDWYFSSSVTISSGFGMKPKPCSVVNDISPANKTGNAIELTENQARSSGVEKIIRPANKYMDPVLTKKWILDQPDSALQISIHYDKVTYEMTNYSRKDVIGAEFGCVSENKGVIETKRETGFRTLKIAGKNVSAGLIFSRATTIRGDEIISPCIQTNTKLALMRIYYSDKTGWEMSSPENVTKDSTDRDWLMHFPNSPVKLGINSRNTSVIFVNKSEKDITEIQIGIIESRGDQHSLLFQPFVFQDSLAKGIGSITTFPFLKTKEASMLKNGAKLGIIEITFADATKWRAPGIRF